MRIIMIKGAVETLEFFSMQMAQTFEKEGMDVWFWDMKAPSNSRREFDSLGHSGGEVLITFNFIGLSGESQFQCGSGASIWEQYSIKTCCIMVDHPIYYFKNLISGAKNLILFCVDRQHKRFVEDYYPEYKNVYFLPLAGTELPGAVLPYEKRDIDIIFTGNYVPIENLMHYISNTDEDTKAFCFDIANEMIENPQVSLEQELTYRLKKEFPGITREELLESMYHLIFVDLYVRSYFRRKIVCSLAEKGHKVLVVGKDWEKSQCRCPENLIMTGQLDSLGCLKYMKRSKIAVNIMPWFKDGAHDRIFNAMLQGCAVVTDTSEYLNGIIKNHRDFLAFSLEQSEHICDKIQYLSDHPVTAGQIAASGYEIAKKQHTWKNRAEQLLHIILSQMI